ncbi:MULTISPECIES: succinate dehydrogenase, hydrophobic membrane anchor protein [Methylobacterium]|jgi:succinate dehydrogenase / fumarate reductase membrane anchor subunit|uniref:Succinate dehydrogenase hydrophobic membrane anchor subunit n=1 Tax=Methylobacterium radiotolerans (strain ATCC 27329 / DSM 1819 / JCM 2831 / NBRC 15690 / NCIMB 10815 / 0-1) TaxID=426355 RepID=B1LU89_METRJ|nr:MULTISPECIES: succinate dehydrogenase, hydrophobic membrane anchor protein [Methylobacterium]GAN47216.1 succinate dehydrogenase, hydrophobic membrane anchor protein [Methylobacterium sp. ME121]ACB22469.1 succinate dehydrogenase, hydrophobic membrane anchor protein [Methylobacterium radiotolerans JCM 2831]MBN6818504.1 succinate dehydrogenase, hydrophobic membrane anchor protein [Methylobacterium organophilum]MBY0253585.1 succinate dehydrogenase, hydrophobic membrane anchor protein [Methylobac
MAKEEVRQDTRVSIRTPRARVRGLGVSHHGADHWWLQRLTAVANVVLMLSFVVIIAKMAGRGYAEARLLVATPLVSILLILALLSVTVHMRLGMQVIIEDYVHAPSTKIAAVFANNAYAVVVAVACLYAVLRIGFGQPA